MSHAGPRPASAPAARPAPRAAAAGSEAANVTVCVRVRPANELERGKPNLVNIVDDNCIVFDPHDADAQQEQAPSARTRKRLAAGRRRTREQIYKFDNVFAPSATQEDVYAATAKNVIDSVLNGFNATVFAYGATGSGKTHTSEPTLLLDLSARAVSLTA